MEKIADGCKKKKCVEGLRLRLSTEYMTLCYIMHYSLAHQKQEEQSKGCKEVPQIMVVIEINQNATFIEFSRRRGGHLKEKVGGHVL